MNGEREDKMKQGQFNVPFSEGFHARPASEFVNLAKQFISIITLVKENKKIDGKSMIQIMTLGLGQGDEFQLHVEGEDEEEAYTKLHTFLGGEA